MSSRFGLINELRLRYAGVFVLLILVSGLILQYDRHQAQRLNLLGASVQRAVDWDKQVSQALVKLGTPEGEGPNTWDMVMLSKTLADARKAVEDFRSVERSRGLLALLVFLGSCLGVWISLSIPRLAQLVQEIRESAGALAASTDDIHRISDEHAKQSAQQAEAVQELAASSEEIAESARSIRTNAEAMKRVMDGALEACVTGRNQLERITAEMRDLQQQVEQIDGGMTQLGEVADRIGSITEIIDEISDQTNLLALNAAIEAAGAGESGKRFAVVATEVRRLSERTAEATGEIATLIAEVRKKIQQTSELTRKGTLAVERGAVEIRDAGSEFQTIFETVEESGYKVNEISTSTEQQKHATQQMADTVSEVQGLVSGVLQGAEGARVAAEGLGGLSNRLLSLVGDGEADRASP